MCPSCASRLVFLPPLTTLGLLLIFTSAAYKLPKTAKKIKNHHADTFFCMMHGCLHLTLEWQQIKLEDQVLQHCLQLPRGVTNSSSLNAQSAHLTLSNCH